MPTPWKPTRQQIATAAGKYVPDLLAPGLDVVFCGINPGLYSGAVGHHFARPGNRFWPALHAGGFTHRLLSPFGEQELLDLGLGITNIVARATASADVLSGEELMTGAGRLKRKIRKYQPAAVAFLGLGAYRLAFGQRLATLGRQPERLAGSEIWILPNPSGLNAHYQLVDLARLFRELRVWVQRKR